MGSFTGLVTLQWSGSGDPIFKANEVGSNCREFATYQFLKKTKHPILNQLHFMALLHNQFVLLFKNNFNLCCLLVYAAMAMELEKQEYKNTLNKSIQCHVS